MMDSDDDEEYLNHINNTNNMMLIITVLLIKKSRASIDLRQLRSIHERRVLSGTIRRKSLQKASESVFWKVYNSNQDDSLIQLCGFHKKAFDELVQLFRPIYEKYTPHDKRIRPVKKTAGRNRLLNATSCLGLVLTWL